MDKLQSFAVSLLYPAGIIVIGSLMIKLIVLIMKKSLNKSKIDKALHKFIINFTKIILVIILLILILDSFGINTRSLVTVLGVTGGAIALSLKDSLSNVSGGIIILVTKPFLKGDFVDISGSLGKVNQIDLLLTTIITPDNKITTIPNGLVATGVITNYTRANLRRVDCSFSIYANENIQKAKSLIFEIIKINPIILNEPAEFIGITGNDKGKVILEVKVWTKTDTYWDVKYYLEEKIMDMLNKNEFISHEKLLIDKKV